MIQMIVVKTCKLKLSIDDDEIIHQKLKESNRTVLPMSPRGIQPGAALPFTLSIWRTLSSVHFNRPSLHDCYLCIAYAIVSLLESVVEKKM